VSASRPVYSTYLITLAWHYLLTLFVRTYRSVCLLQFVYFISPHSASASVKTRLKLSLNRHADVIETTSRTTVWPASWPRYVSVDAGRCDTRDHQRSSAAPLLCRRRSCTVRWGEPANFNALRRSLGQRHPAVRLRLSCRSQPLQSASSPERNLWSKRSWPYLASIRCRTTDVAEDQRRVNRIG